MRLVLLFMALASSLHADPRPMNERVLTKADRIAPTFVLDLRPGDRHTFETRNLSKGADTVLLLMDDVRPLDWNDDREPRPTDKRPPVESYLEFTATRRAPYSIQVRARQGTLEGECDLYVDGQLKAKGLKFGARYKREKREPMAMPTPYRSGPEPELEQYDVERPWR